MKIGWPVHHSPAHLHRLHLLADAVQQLLLRQRFLRQYLRAADYKCFAELGVVASMQPFHIIDDGRWAETLQVGKLADLVVLSRDILAEKERDAIAEAKVEMTVVGGKVVFEHREK
jgi:predicted amidohydrolase YtcJ